MKNALVQYVIIFLSAPEKYTYIKRNNKINLLGKIVSGTSLWLRVSRSFQGILNSFYWFVLFVLAGCRRYYQLAVSSTKFSRYCRSKSVFNRTFFFSLDSRKTKGINFIPKRFYKSYFSMPNTSRRLIHRNDSLNTLMNFIQNLFISPASCLFNR